ncbi:MAG: hypothetical protein IIB57_08630 [Planctomycetes bacterium]|nr:hypothetical protein [Planctomycetota bacterium]
MAAYYDYYADGRVHFVTFLNGARTEYAYDAAGRVTVIDHQNDSGISLLKLSYDYDKRDLPVTVTEEDLLNVLATTTFTYDNRGRLTGESRTGAGPYHLLYEYDKGGNRSRKVDLLNQIEVLYEYDVDNVAIFGAVTNRLRQYVTCDMSAGADCELYAITPASISFTWYHYNDVGNVMRVIIFRRNPETVPYPKPTRSGFRDNFKRAS